MQGSFQITVVSFEIFLGHCSFSSWMTDKGVIDSWNHVVVVTNMGLGIL